MKNYIYAASSGKPAPMAGGDEVSWLKYYKLDPEVGLTWVPVAEGLVEAGDRLWFVLDGWVTAYVTIDYVTDDAMNSRSEAHYDAAKLIIKTLGLLLTHHALETGLVDNGQADLWLQSFKEG